MTGPDGPVWICSIPGGRSVFAEGARPADAAAAVVREGLPKPSAVELAGYSAGGQETRARAEGERAKDDAPAGKPSPRALRRTEIVLQVYALLRCDFPINSILRPHDAALRLPSTNVLRDFMADVGQAIAALTEPTRTLDDVIVSQCRAWLAGAREKNLRGRGRDRDAEVERERVKRHRENAARLRKRVGYRRAAAELSITLDGLLPSADRSAEGFRKSLISAGLGTDEANEITTRLRRVKAPRL